MQWKKRNYTSIHDAVNQKSEHRANEFLQIEPLEPNAIQNLDVAASWLKHYASKDISITIVGDYDADGIDATAALASMLWECGAKKVTTRLPKRMSEGYGLSPKIVDEISQGIVVTVDNGIASIEAIQKAKDKGLVVIIIDHHLPVNKDGKVILPPADLIIDPHVENQLIAKGPIVETTFQDYCGAGLVYKLAQIAIPDTIALDKIAAFACIATVADVMPLINDNRNIFRAGIHSMKHGKVTGGVQALVDMLQSGNIVTATDIGFRIAPMINAPGRIYDEGAAKSLNAILADTSTQAKVLTDELKSINEERKKLKKEAVERALHIMDKNCLYGINPIIIIDPETPEGIVGLVAGELEEKFNASAIALTKKEGFFKGSARAQGNDHIKNSLDSFNHDYPGVLMGYGGHKGAAGLSISEDKINIFTEQFPKYMSEYKGLPDTLYYDIEIEAGQVEASTNETLLYAPFGNGNPDIIFKINHFKLVPQNNSFYRVIGTDSVKFSSAGCSAIGFGMLDKYLADNYPTEIDIIGKLSYHYYLGKQEARIEIIDFKQSAQENVFVPDISMAIAKTLQSI